MLANLRKYAKTAAIVVLFGILIVAFATFSGMDDIMSPGVKSSVLKAGDREVSGPEFKRDVESRLPEMEQQYQRPVTLMDIAKADVDQQMLQGLSMRESLNALLVKVGLKPGDQMTANRLREISAFFDPVTGAFDRKAYLSRLQGEGIDPKVFERGLADEIANRHFEAGMTAGLSAPRAYGVFQAAYLKDNRSISFFTLDASKVAAAPKPTDAQLTALMNEFADNLRDPELRQLTIVRFSASKMTAGAAIDQAQVQKLFDFRKEQASTPETRTLVHIPVKDAAAGQAAAARLAKGEDAAAVAKSLGSELISYADKPKTAIPDRKVADAAFALPAGQVSAPIKGDLGFAVVRVLSITPGKQADLAAMRKTLEEEARKTAAEQQATKAADKFQELHEAGASLADAARQAGGEVFTPPLVASSGMARGGVSPPGLTPKAVVTAFRLTNGAESEIEADSRGEYYVVKVDKVIPPALPPLESRRADLEQAWTQRDVNTRLKAKGDELAARVRKGESLEAAAASIGASVQKAGPIDRSNAQQFQRLGEVLGQALQGKKGELFIGAAGAVQGAPQKAELIIARVDAIGVATADELAQMTAQVRPQVNRQITGDLRDQLMNGARAVIKPKTWPERAREALGVDVPLTNAAGEKGKEKKG